MMERLQETGGLSLQQQNCRVRQLVILAHVKVPDPKIDARVEDGLVQITKLQKIRILKNAFLLWLY